MVISCEDGCQDLLRGWPVLSNSGCEERGRNKEKEEKDWTNISLWELSGKVVFWSIVWNSKSHWDMLDLNMIWEHLLPLGVKDWMTHHSKRKRLRQKEIKTRKKKWKIRELEKKMWVLEKEKESWKRKITPNRIFMNIASFSFMFCCWWWWDLDTRALAFW